MGRPLNARHPQVPGYDSSSEYEQFGAVIPFVSIFLAGAGVLMILRALSTWISGYFSDQRPPRMFPEMVRRNVIPWKRHQSMALICDTSSFKVVCVGVLFVLLLFSLVLAPLTPKGLLVDFREQRAVGVRKSPWAETISVYVDARKGLLVNGHQVKPDELEAKLNEELSRQMVWTVYLEADSDCFFTDLAQVMDTIQGLGAKVVWITPKMREEWKQKSTP